MVQSRAALQGQTVPPGNMYENSGDSNKKPKWVRAGMALELRKQGKSYSEIGKAIGLSGARARLLVVETVNAERAEGVKELREVEGQRLDKMLDAIWARAIDGELPAIDRVLRIMERRSRLFGLDAPIQVDVSTDTDRQIEELARALTVQGEVTKSTTESNDKRD